MSNKVIFLSYRRGDSPGYVKTLEEELERHYGKGRVFRDVEDIVGGTKWKQVLEDNLRNSAALLLVIGPRWDSLWCERMNDKVNYVAWELNLAQQLDVPVIPITLGGSMISDDTDLKSVSWLRENQFYDMSDKQGRWDNDFNGLLKILSNVEGLEKPKQPSNEPTDINKGNNQSNPLKTGLIAAAVIICALVVLGAMLPDATIETPAATGKPTGTEPGTIAVEQQKSLPEVKKTGTKLASPPAGSIEKEAKKYPNLDGTWQSSIDGGLYKITHEGSRNFSLFASDYGTFVGRFVDNQPGKIRITLNAGGSGEFSLSNSSEKLIGWVIYDDGSKDCGTLHKIR